MRFPQLSTAIAAAISMSLFGFVGTASAGDGPQAYVTSGSGHVVRVKDRQGRCVRTKDWSEELATRECDPDLFPEEAEVVAVAAPVYEKSVMSASALFAFDSAELSEDGATSLQALGESIRAKGARVVDIDIVGHTDSSGPEAYNQKLSLRRAEAMKAYLVREGGIDAAIIDVMGKGESMPVADNATREGRARNRRVEVNVGVEAPPTM
jgi:OOP family OmpA-OmpF porin